MKTRKHSRTSAVLAALAATGLLFASGTSVALEQAEERRDARDMRQDTRQDSRETKVDCRAADQQNNPECRQDTRDSRQEGRDQARDIKY